MNPMTESAEFRLHLALQTRCMHHPGGWVESREEIDQSIPARFEKIVAKYPDHPAVKAKDGDLTYRELDESASRLAHSIIRARGPAAEPVGILVDHGVSGILAMLAVLKSGKFYVPLDPHYPLDRLRYMLDDTNSTLIVTDQSHHTMARELVGADMLILTTPESTAEPLEELPALPLGQEAIAAIYYTSGSTGRPKGIVYTHGYLLHNMKNYGNTFRISRHDRWTWLHSYGFSPASTDIFCPLLHGATVCPWDVQYDGFTGLGEWLDDMGITVLHWMATPFLTFAATLDQVCTFCGVRLVIFGGEKLLTRDVRSFEKFFAPSCIFANRLGASEAGLYKVYFWGRETPLNESSVPAGYSIPEKTAIILDETGAELPLGAIGEIGVRSEYLPPGYWRQPELTRQKYRNIGNDTGTRMYLTGDLGRYRPDGNLEFLGRLDDQVKLRGFRIELGEIESVLNEHPDVSQSVVILREDRPGDKRLVAYCVSAAGIELNLSELRTHLRSRLPDYMLPAAFVILDAFPLTSSGKVNRRGLSAPDDSRPELETHYVAPQTPIEQQLARIWGEVPGIEDIGIEDNFLPLADTRCWPSGVNVKITSATQVNALFHDPAIGEIEAKMRATDDLCRSGQPGFGETATVNELLWSRFQETVISHADRPAVVTGEETISYLQLLGRAEALAGRIGEPRLGDYYVVGVLTQRGLASIVGILGALRAGATFVYLDPAHPPARIDRILQHCGAECLVTDLPRLDVPSTFRGRVLIFGDDEAAAGTGRIRLPSGHPDEAACVIYTSGSTGEPKGVIKTHRSLGAEVTRFIRHHKFNTNDRVSHLLSPGVVGGLREILAALLSGATLYPFDLFSHGILGFASWLSKERITICRMVSSVFRELLSVVSGTSNFPDVRLLYLGGEPVSQSEVVQFHQQFPASCRLEVIYGLTETGICCSCFVNADVSRRLEAVPIGFPIEGYKVRIVNESGEEMPQCDIGQIVVSSRFLSPGYWRQPRLTAQAYRGIAADPLGRWLWTGDLGRQQANGLIEHLGRCDSQVQVRGYRVEIAEVENTIVNAPFVTSAAVVSVEKNSETKLVAFVHAESESQSIAQLRQWCALHLPQYAIPSVFRYVECLPHTIQGKIDRQHLIALCMDDEFFVDASPVSSAAYEPPQKTIETNLADIWAKRLGLSQVGIEDDFFELGGNSLAAMGISGRASQLFGVEVAVRAVFVHPTVNAMAMHIASLLLDGSATKAASRVSPDQGEGLLVLSRQSRQPNSRALQSFAQQRLWFLEQLQGGLTAYNMPYGWKLRGPLDVEALRRALEEIVQRHEPLRTTFAVLDDAPMQVIRPSGRFELPVEDLSSLEPEQQETENHRLRRLEAEKPFNLSTDLMLRASLLHLADDEHMLLLTMHHIASDGWSLQILLRELAGLYDAYCRGAASNLRELPVQYADYAIWQRSELEGQRLEQLLQYWREQLKGVSPLELPTDHPRPARPTYRGAQHSFELPEELVSQLKRLSQTAGVTLQMTLLAAFQTLLSRYSGQDDIAVGVPVAGRSHADLEDLIGFFVNTLVLRTDLSGDPTFRELLGRVREVSLAAYDHQDLPFAKLVEELRPERQLSRSPLFQVMFQLLNFVGEGLALPNLKVSRLDMSGEGDQAFSNLDIVVALSPRADGGIIAHWSFNTALFKRETMCFLADSYRRLLEQVVEDTGTSLKHFSLADARTPLYPLTLAQRDIWIDQILHGDTPLYNIGGHVHLPGPLDIDRLRQSIQLLTQKHDSLRLQLTKSRDENGIPQQTSVPSLEVEVPLHDFRGEAEPLKAARRWMQQRFVQPFTLEGQPLFRYDLIRVADENHYWLIQYHHLIIDGWGIALLNRSLAELYTALSQGRAPDLQSPSYLDHVADAQSYLQSEQYGNHRSYWLQRYDSVPDPLLTSRTPDKGLAASDCYTVPLSRDLYQQLGILAKQYQASTFHVIIGALALYFTRTQGRDEFVIGLPVLNRSKAAFKNTAGPFTGVIPTRLQVKADASFGELLRGIAQTLRADYRRQRFPIGEINRAVKPATQHHQLYDIGLSYESHDYDAKFDTITSHSEPLLHGWEQTPLMLYVREFHAQADVNWDFVANRAYFSSQEIERLQGHLVSLLATLLTRAETPMWQLSLLSETERHQLLVEWNDTAIEYPREKCVHELFEEQVERTPDAVAVIFEEQELTYRELNERANQLAHHLIALGVGPETLVGLCLERSPELVVGILGILKAGGAYVPLDADYPPQRLEFMLRDSAVRYLVTQSSLLDRLPSHGCCVTCLDNEAETLKASDCSNLYSGVGADNLAYVMYTSGSTGVPKGVAIPQSAVVNFLLSMSDQPGMSSDDRLLSVTTPTFDISVLELLLPLTVGASLDVVPAPLNADGIGLADYVSMRNATVMQATPATWQMMLQSGWQGCRQLKVLCGGEALSDHLADELQQRCSQLWNMYGPTETTIWSTTRLVAGQGACGSIGRPITNTQVYVLDAQRQPIPIGVPGELYIGGAGLARGYLNRPDLTAERFVANPFSADPAARLYRTGDLCRWRMDGNLEFLRRIDNQVKLRGFRIELGEIESVLNAHPDVAQSVVIVREDRPGDKRLVAYCVSAAGIALNLSDLRSQLRAKLPEYMVPSAYVMLATLPLTSSGKVNRHALPAPDDSRPELETGYVAPRNGVEQQLASIWCELLPVDRVGIDDDFFQLGGHSLMAVRLFARMEKTFGQKLPLAVLFQQGTIRHLATLLAESGGEAPVAKVLELQPKGEGRRLFLMPSIGGELLFSKPLLDEFGTRFPVLGLQPALSPRNLEQFQDFRTTATHFVSALRAYQPHGPYALAGFSYGGFMAYEVACQLDELGETVDLLAVIDTGPGRRGLPPGRGDRLSRLPRILANLPPWLREELRDISVSRWIGSAGRKLRHVRRRLTSMERYTAELDDVFDASRVLTQNRELMRTVFAAFRDYIPERCSVKLTLFRARTRSLLGDSSLDLGWSRFVDDPDVCHINGNHETILHSPHVKELARQLSERLDHLTPKVQPAHKTPEA